MRLKQTHHFRVRKVKVYCLITLICLIILISHIAQLFFIHKFCFHPGRHISFKYARHNHLRFSLHCHNNKILPKDLQLKSRIKTERSKIILQRAGKLMLQERIHISHIIRDRFKIASNSEKVRF